MIPEQVSTYPEYNCKYQACKTMTLGHCLFLRKNTEAADAPNKKKGQNMDRNLFNEKIKEIIEQNVSAEAKVIVQRVRKINNVFLDGIIIQMPDSNVSPTIYLEIFYKMYEAGMELEEIAARVLAEYYRGRPRKKLNLDFFKEFDKVKDRIVYRLINAEKNKELLEEVPHILLQDLAICFYYAFSDEQLGEGSITIYNKHMEWWNTSHQELLRLAEINTPRLFPAKYQSLKDMVKDFYGNLPECVNDGICHLYVLTNTQQCNGAVCLLYKDKLEEISKMLGGNFYILPSSVHEVIVLRDTGREIPEKLHHMIKEVNEMHLEADEILSDYPYYYNQQDKKLICLNKF